MKPVIYLKASQFNEFNYPNGIEYTTIKGYAFSKDDDTVFHAFPLPFTSNYSENIIPSIFVLSKSKDILSATKQHIHTYAQKNTLPVKRLFIFIVKTHKAVNYKTYLQKENTITPCEVKLIPERSALYSRSAGLLETETLATKKVAIVGLGSGGSMIALELAKAGIGKFMLIDFDRLELSNVARHICGIDDLGRLKTYAVRDAILQKNPYAEIETLEIDITEEREACDQALSNVDLIIGASDNDRSRFLINEIALKYRRTALFGRALTRAIGGDIMRVRPFRGPCYSCLYSQQVRTAGGDDEEISQKKQAKKLMPGYTSEEDIQASIQVGLASDIAPIANMMVKLSLVELSRGLNTGISSLEKDLVADFYIWANRRENVYECWSKLEYNFNQPAILRWYGARVSRDPDCMVCGG